MTENKSGKRRIRARMARTGERYTAARHNLIDTPRSEPPTSPKPSTPPAAAASPRDELVIARTGRSAREWFDLLDAWGGADRPHPEIARWLNSEHGVDGWWSQELTVRYEQAIGRRKPGQMADGFAIGVTRTFDAPIERLFAAWVDEEVRAGWLPDVELRQRTATPHRSARFDVGDGATRLIVGFTARGEGRSTSSLSHERLPDAETADERKAFWRARMAELRELLEG